MPQYITEINYKRQQTKILRNSSPRLSLKEYTLLN